MSDTIFTYLNFTHYPIVFLGIGIFYALFQEKRDATRSFLSSLNLVVAILGSFFAVSFCASAFIADFIPIVWYNIFILLLSQAFWFPKLRSHLGFSAFFALLWVLPKLLYVVILTTRDHIQTSLPNAFSQSFPTTFWFGSLATLLLAAVVHLIRKRI